MVNHSEHTYLFSQALLKEISEKAADRRALISRIWQEVELNARHRNHSVTTTWISSITGAEDFSKTIAVITNILSSNALIKTDISKLYQMYREIEPPPIALLRAPAIIEMFISLLFIPNSNTQYNTILMDQKAKSVWLFAYASCVWEDWDRHGNR